MSKKNHIPEDIIAVLSFAAQQFNRLMPANQDDINIPVISRHDLNLMKATAKELESIQKSEIEIRAEMLKARTK